MIHFQPHDIPPPNAKAESLGAEVHADEQKVDLQKTTNSAFTDHISDVSEFPKQRRHDGVGEFLFAL